MNYKVGYMLAAAVFGFMVLLLAYPYLQARLTPSQALPQADQSTDTDSEDVAVASQPNTLAIRELGIVAPVIYINEKTEDAYQKALRDGVVHYPGTALPGEPGNVYIFGHSSDYVWAPGDYKTIFAKLPEMKVGDQIEITDAEGKLFIYEVTETKIVWPRDLSVLDQFNDEKHILTLQTSYPLGTALQRYIVVAELKSDLEDAEKQG